MKGRPSRETYSVSFRTDTKEYNRDRKREKYTGNVLQSLLSSCSTARVVSVSSQVQHNKSLIPFLSAHYYIPLNWEYQLILASFYGHSRFIVPPLPVLSTEHNSPQQTACPASHWWSICGPIWLALPVPIRLPFPGRLQTFLLFADILHLIPSVLVQSNVHSLMGQACMQGGQ